LDVLCDRHQTDITPRPHLSPSLPSEFQLPVCLQSLVSVAVRSFVSFDRSPDAYRFDADIAGVIAGPACLQLALLLSLSPTAAFFDLAKGRGREGVAA
jgi:hypothetical protein